MTDQETNGRESSPLALDNEIATRVMQQAFDLWINPEIERRRAAGRLPEDFALYAAQVVMDLDSELPQVRLNGEVKAVMSAPASRPVELGEELSPAEFGPIESIELTDADPNAAHLTMICHHGVWALVFDFRYNAARVTQVLRVAREFLDTAGFALEKGYLRAFVDNVFSAVELLAKGRLLLLPDRSILQGKRHSLVQGRYNWFGGKLGNVDPRYVRLLNQLERLRTPARYPPSTFALTAETGKELLAVAEHMFKDLQLLTPARITIPPEIAEGRR